MRHRVICAAPQPGETAAHRVARGAAPAGRPGRRRGPPAGAARSASGQPPPRPGGDVPTAIGLGAGTIFLVALVAFLLGLSMVLVLLGSIRRRGRLPAAPGG